MTDEAPDLVDRLVASLQPKNLQPSANPPGSSAQQASGPAVPPLPGPTPSLCPTCDGAACEEGCGECSQAYMGPDSHRVCRTCHGSGLAS